MQIQSKTIQIQSLLPPSVEDIEKKIHELGFEPVRWAIVKNEDNLLTISMACEK